jgi:hypothetical protein
MHSAACPRLPISGWQIEARPGWRIGRLGFTGEAAINIEPAVRDQIATTGADVVVIQAGTNDATAAVFQPARRAGASQVIVLTIAPRST